MGSTVSTLFPLLDSQVFYFLRFFLTFSSFYTMKVFAVIALASVAMAADSAPADTYLTVTLEGYPKEGETRTFTVKKGDSSWASDWDLDTQRPECSFLKTGNNKWELRVRATKDQRRADHYMYRCLTPGASLDSLADPAKWEPQETTVSRNV